MRTTTRLGLLSAVTAIPLASLRAQVAPPAPASLNARIVDLYNRRDTAALQALWVVEPNKAWLADFLRRLREQTGTITATREVARYPGGAGFIWQGERSNLRFDFYTKGGAVVENWSLTDFTPQPASAPNAVATDNPLKTSLDSLVHERALLYLADTGTVGLSIGVLRHGRRSYYDYGESARGSHALPTPRTFYELGSITKTFVTTLLARAVTEGRVRLTDDVRQYLPGAYPNLAYEGRPIRLVDLANHTSGLPFWTITRPDSLDRLTPYQQHLFYETYTLRDLARDLHDVTLRAAPGTRYEYSGTGINVLILVLERVYGRPFDRRVRDYYGARYGMTDTKKVLSAAEVSRAVTGYDERGLAVPYFAQYTAALGPELVSTPTDMLAYLAANLSGDPALALSHEPTYALPHSSEQLGLGWRLGRDWFRDRTIYHTGSGFGGNSAAYLYPARGLGIVVLVNEKRGQDRVDELVRSLEEVLR